MKEAACFTLGYVAGHTAELAQQVCRPALLLWHACFHGFIMHRSLLGRPAILVAAKAGGISGGSLGSQGTRWQPA